MEKIRINEITKKDSGLVIVKYWAEIPNSEDCTIKEATLNTKWQAQEVDYLEKDVGIGGEVSVLIVKKGDYTNITKVDFASAVKGNVKPVLEDQHVVTGDFNRNNSIIAQCLTKACLGTMPEPIGIDACVRMYKEALKLLDE